MTVPRAACVTTSVAWRSGTGRLPRGEFATLSTTRALKKLEVADLKIEDHKPPSSSSKSPAATRRAVSILTISAALANARAKLPQRAGVTGSPTRERGSILDQLTGKKK